ncbi:galectin-3 [Boleophthalmus pectinirostris]|uniref:galectin-3 n=1 Tax=Boleophthalmus pectinirostris TaxID=150288 RepID=UPI0024301734|nr:galectin-3 [Boleophthalmus pectinirostris]
MDPLCGGCVSSGSVPQPSMMWPVQASGSSFPAWPGTATQFTQAAPPQPQNPCWNGQPGTTPCWSVPSQQMPSPVLAPAPVPMSVPAPAPPPAPMMVQAPQMVPAQVQTPMVSVPAVAPPPAMVQTPAPVQPCPTQTCWTPAAPAVPTQVSTPMSTPVPSTIPAPVLTPAPITAPAAAPSSGQRPYIWPPRPSWYHPGQSGWPGQHPNFLPPNWLPPTSGPLSVPYNLNLSRGVYDKMMMTIVGQVKPDAKMFTVNFLKGNDIAFHVNPRFSEGGKQVLVRNHKVGDRWGPEERDLKGAFPFAKGSPFEMKILCTHESFRVAVNNLPLFEFKHRVTELNQVNRINILHDVILNFVHVETLP